MLKCKRETNSLQMYNCIYLIYAKILLKSDEFKSVRHIFLGYNDIENTKYISLSHINSNGKHVTPFRIHYDIKF